MIWINKFGSKMNKATFGCELEIHGMYWDFYDEASIAVFSKKKPDYVLFWITGDRPVSMGGTTIEVVSNVIRDTKEYTNAVNDFFLYIKENRQNKDGQMFVTTLKTSGLKYETPGWYQFFFVDEKDNPLEEKGPDVNIFSVWSTLDSVKITPQATIGFSKEDINVFVSVLFFLMPILRKFGIRDTLCEDLLINKHPEDIISFFLYLYTLQSIPAETPKQSFQLKEYTSYVLSRLPLLEHTGSIKKFFSLEQKYIHDIILFNNIKNIRPFKKILDSLESEQERAAYKAHVSHYNIYNSFFYIKRALLEFEKKINELTVASKGEKFSGLNTDWMSPPVYSYNSLLSSFAKEGGVKHNFEKTNPDFLFFNREG